MNIKEFIQKFALKTKHFIEIYESFKDLTGAEKKAKLDEVITEWAERSIETVSVNFVIKWALKNILIKNIPYLTQAVFDLLKARIEGITEA